jgi:hypothetical protein
MSSSNSHTKLNELESAATTPTWRFTTQTVWSQQLKKLKKDLTPKYIYIYI